MAAASSQQDNSSVIDQGIPQWKRELILRRRALARTLPAGNASVKLTCPSVVTAVRQAEQQGATAVENVSGKQQRCISPGIASNKGLLDQAQADFHPRGRVSDSSSPSSTVTAAVVGNMRLVEHHVEAGTGLTINGVGVDTNTVPIDRDTLKYRSKMGEEKSVKKSCASSRTIMDNSVVMSVNNNCNHPHEEDCQSDSSEELQYGPGIVNKLKSKYLSMTLRENQNKGIRPSLANMRRAASLENLLDSDDLVTGKPQIKSQCRFAKKADTGYSVGKTPHSSHHQQRYRGISRGNDSMKRARSVEALFRYDSRTTVYKSGSRDVNKNNAPVIKPLVNDEIVIVESKPKVEAKKSVTEDRISIIQPKMRTSSVASDTELPPPDLVKQTLKIFENSSSSKPPRVTLKTGTSGAKTSSSKSANLGKLNAASANINLSGASAKPLLSPKPSPEKIRRNTNKPQSPRKVPPVPSSPDTVQSNRLFPLDSNSPPSSPTYSIGPVGLRKLKSPSPTNDTRKGLFTRRDSSDSEHNSLSPVPHGNLVVNGRVDTTIFPSDEDLSTDEDILDGATKSVSSLALENIRKDGTSMQFSFSANGNAPNQKSKSYLPGVKRVANKSPSPAVESPVLTKPTSIVSVLPVLKSPDSPQTQGKQIGIIRPLITSKVSPPPVSLTDREIEKNLINREKSIEPSLNKVSVKNAVDSAVIEMDVSKVHVDDSVKSVLPSSLRMGKDKDSKGPGLWDKKPWNQPQNTMVFDFSGRKDPPPDYIENDGLIIRRKTKPKPGESGIILLGSSADESSTDFEPEDFGPPSPCNVHFEGDNILINGRSNLRKEPRHLKLSIKFDDAATTTYEYPSEASLLNEAGGNDTPSNIISTSPGSLPLPPPPSGPTPGLPVPLDAPSSGRMVLNLAWSRNEEESWVEDCSA
ncbi:uncharacterized protein bif isoform X2 [Anabrus simplex]|uniref:uncharacterized protein bif isoform X2 n=1 Tax=Anabrus simplex TaxID=316456 RepID=UPI0035A3266E